MLSQSHPTYIQNLHHDFLRARAKGDFEAFILAVIATLVLPPGVPVGASNAFLFRPTAKLLIGDAKVYSQ